MLKGKSILGVVLMREGSKRIKHKCIKPFLGTPLAKIALDKMRLSRYIDEIVVSTSSEYYKAIVKKWGYDVIDRPEELSGPDVFLADVMRDVARQRQRADYIVQVDLCCPQGTIEAIDEVIHEAVNDGHDSCFAVKMTNGIMVNEAPKTAQAASPKYFHFNFCRVRSWETAAKAEGWGKGADHYDIAVIKPHWIDIDTRDDFRAAEALVMAGL